MDKNKNKGLTDDDGEGEFILNESGTSVTIDVNFPEDEKQDNADEQTEDDTEKMEDSKDE